MELVNDPKLNKISDDILVKNARSDSAESKYFTLRVGLRLTGVCFFGCLTIFLIFNSPYWMSAIWTALITGALFYNTVRYVNLSERKLTAFLQSIRQNDFTVTFSENENTGNYNLHQAFNELNQKFKNLRSDKESQHHLLQVIVSHAAVPLICFDESNEEIYLVNDAAKSLLHIQFLTKLESLSRVDVNLPAFLRAIVDNEKESLRIIIDSKTTFLSVTSRHFIFADKKLKLVALTDVSSELAAKEAEAWHKLLRVLTHEISNSAIPLSTLSSYIHEMITSAETEGRTLSPDERKDVVESLRAIDQRSRSLKEFVRNFKDVNSVPEPQLIKLAVNDLIEEINHFFIKELERENVNLMITPLKDAYIYVDRSLTMQVLINLMKNAMEAMGNMKEGKVIGITASKAGSKYVNLHISDNGCGIPPEDIDQIFIPFYSTKKGGSGIGLSIAHQIMQKQKGDLSVVSTPSKGSVFTVSFTA